MTEMLNKKFVQQVGLLDEEETYMNKDPRFL